MRLQSAPFQDNYSLVFQFVLTEYITIFEVTDRFRDALKEKDLEAILQALYKLNGPPEGNFNVFSGATESGLLPKMCHSSFHLSSMEEDNEALSQKLNKHAQQTHKLTSMALKVCQDANPLKPQRTLLNLKQLLLKIEVLIQRIGQIITKMMGQFEDDEAVLFFLLRNAEQLDAVFYPHYVLKLFIKMFHNGPLEAEQYIMKQYSQRGFDHLLPEIAKLVMKL